MKLNDNTQTKSVDLTAVKWKAKKKRIEGPASHEPRQRPVGPNEIPLR